MEYLLCVLFFVSESVQTHKETHLDIAFQCAANDGYYQMFADHTLSTEQFEFVFQAKGLDGAHVALLTHDEPQKSRDPNCYEIVIGSFNMVFYSGFLSFSYL
jgi:hypothetical protein